MVSEFVSWQEEANELRKLNPMSQQRVIRMIREEAADPDLCLDEDAVFIRMKAMELERMLGLISQDKPARKRRVRWMHDN
jgi:hypothetical protein